MEPPSASPAPAPPRTASPLASRSPSQASLLALHALSPPASAHFFPALSPSNSRTEQQQQQQQSSTPHFQPSFSSQAAAAAAARPPARTPSPLSISHTESFANTKAPQHAAPVPIAPQPTRPYGENNAQAGPSTAPVPIGRPVSAANGYRPPSRNSFGIRGKAGLLDDTEGSSGSAADEAEGLGGLEVKVRSRQQPAYARPPSHPSQQQAAEATRPPLVTRRSNDSGASHGSNASSSRAPARRINAGTAFPTSTTEIRDAAAGIAADGVGDADSHRIASIRRARSRSWTSQPGATFTPASTGPTPSPRDSSPEGPGEIEQERDWSSRPPVQHRRQSSKGSNQSRSRASSSASSRGNPGLSVPAMTPAAGIQSRNSSRSSTRASTPAPESEALMSSSLPSVLLGTSPSSYRGNGTARPSLTVGGGLTPPDHGTSPGSASTVSGGASGEAGEAHPFRTRSSPHLNQLHRLANSFSPIHSNNLSAPSPSPPALPLDYATAAAAAMAAAAAGGTPGYFDMNGYAVAAAAAAAGLFSPPLAPHEVGPGGMPSPSHVPQWTSAQQAAAAAALGLHHSTHSSPHLLLDEPLSDVPPPYSPPPSVAGLNAAFPDRSSIRRQSSASATRPTVAQRASFGVVTAPPSDNEDDFAAGWTNRTGQSSSHGSRPRRSRTAMPRMEAERGPSVPAAVSRWQESASTSPEDGAQLRRRRAASHDATSMARLQQMVNLAQQHEESLRSDLRHRQGYSGDHDESPSQSPPAAPRSEPDSIFDGVTSGGEGAYTVSEPDTRSPRNTSSKEHGSSDDDLFVWFFLLQPLRLLAAVPGLLGTFWLMRNCVTLALQQQDLRRLGERRAPGPLDFFAACLWVSAIVGL